MGNSFSLVKTGCQFVLEINVQFAFTWAPRKAVNVHSHARTIAHGYALGYLPEIKNQGTGYHVNGQLLSLPVAGLLICTRIPGSGRAWGAGDFFEIDPLQNKAGSHSMPVQSI